MKINTTCKNCQKEFLADTRELNRGNAKFCSRSCSTQFSNKNITRKTTKCENCGEDFETNSRSKAKYCCKNCKMQSYREKQKLNNSSIIKSLYKQIQDIPCQICGWKEASRDIHHILPVSKGGKDELSNLVVLCPNCHRMAHHNLITEDILRRNALSWTISSS